MTIILALHSLNRWLVLALVAARAAKGLGGGAMGSEWTKPDKLLGLAALIAVDIQMLLGFILLGLSDVTTSAFADMGAAMKNPVLRFFTVEHTVMAIIGITALHVGFAVTKKEGRPDKTRHLIAGGTYLVALLCFAAAIPWPFREAIARGLFPSF